MVTYDMVTASWLVRRAGVGGATGQQWSAPARPKPARENFSNLLFITELSGFDKDFRERKRLVVTGMGTATPPAWPQNASMLFNHNFPPVKQL
jgi:hypothetical protein